ncbi:hypothetical protein CBF86_02855 [Limosilactobacillus reuteri]|uniref:hypothetical protein n=1 Tax=Limosilactobacillus reuteri TaxID=1598 RepID=UPI000B995FDF|nr:hypothetical protein [Limosilactobacillus reuteri]OYS49277.1 hypothetical protein CBF86_02855 [Limosilactobacillus reuteri]OYS50774.1 hypothetical protein CBF84_02155 [Limosilactobacillus reuteri]OYS55350.1 hypothetical protein CBF92_02260 [Limosilactobacillus reuteri]OYS56261.1 hypothetical protein CBF95_03590 [Limosilactobacillus reuteri]OYS58885.1 hypothetical protein CBF93_05360 [Limosilactobacillus reuteri]
MGEPNNLKYLEKTSPQALIDVLNSDLEQTANRYNSFCQLINDRLAIYNSLHYNHSPIDSGFNRRTRLDLIKNIRDLNQAFERLASLLNRSPFKKLDKGQIIPYDFTAWIDVGIKLTKEQINDYIKQVENVLKELFDFKTKYRLND